ncbi:MAG: hypothetical protein ABIJ56_21135 [Pseudomonadota bacterium]
MKKQSIVIMVSCFSLFLNGGCGTKEERLRTDLWIVTVGGGGDDSAAAHVEVTGGGVTAAGITNSFGSGKKDGWIAAADKEGLVLWQKAYGGIEDDLISSLKESADGGFLAAGRTANWGSGLEDMWIIRLDAGGSIAWQKVIGGERLDYANSATQTSDGGILVCGRTGSLESDLDDGLVVKLDGGGELVWQKAFKSDLFEEAYSIVENGDGDIIVFGNAGPQDNLDLWAARLDASGNIQWQKNVGGDEDERAVAMLIGSDGTVVMVGTTESFGAGASDIWVVRLDAGGSVLWQKTVGGDDDDFPGGAAITSDGGILVAGQTWSLTPDENEIYAFVLKLDAAGNILWQRNIGGNGIYEAHGVKESSGGMVTVTGKSLLDGSGNFDIFVARLESMGSASIYCDLITDTGFEAVDSEGESWDGEAVAEETAFTLLASEAAALDTDAAAAFQCPL